MGRVLCIDLGKKRIGVAISDSLKLFAQPLKTLAFSGEEKLLQEIRLLVESRDVEIVVIGYPLHQDGRESKGCLAARRLRDRLKSSDVPCVLFDERHSSQDAQAILHAHGKRRERHREKIDRIAAAIILDEYLKSLAKKD